MYALFSDLYYNISKENIIELILTPNSQLTLACQGNTTSAKYIILCIFFTI